MLARDRQMFCVSFDISPLGPFDLGRLARFGFGQRDDPDFDGCMRIAFVADDHSTSVGVEVRQPRRDLVEVRAQTDREVDVEDVCRQVLRMLSLDHDANAYVDIGRRDDVVGDLQRLAPGLRPPLFHSPYEAAAWAVLSARRHSVQAARVRRVQQRVGRRESIRMWRRRSRLPGDMAVHPRGRAACDGRRPCA